MEEITYGFANKKSGILDNVENEINTIFDIHNVHTIALPERRNLRFDSEKVHFSEDYFLSDYFADAIIHELVVQPNPWLSLEPESIAFHQGEKDFLNELPDIEYQLTNDEINQVLYGLLDILYAYCYEQRSNNFNGGSDSGWTITKISSTLSWFDVFSGEEEVLIACFRRVMIYPFYRNFELAKAVLEDVKILLTLGQIFIVQCLIDIYNIFLKIEDPRSILNDLYIKDYIIFMQKCPEENFELLMKNMDKIKFINVDDLKLNLREIIEEQYINDTWAHSGEGDTSDSSLDSSDDSFSDENLENETVD